MQAKFTAEDDCVVVHLIGRIDVETAGPFRQACLEQLTDKKVIFNFRELSFVGSSGILTFLETMQDFAKVNRRGLRFCAVGTEFRKLLAATALSVVEIHDNERLAALSLTQAVPGIGAGAATLAVPTMESHVEPQRSEEPPRMPPMIARAHMEGINPIFNVTEDVEGEAPEVADAISEEGEESSASN